MHVPLVLFVTIAHTALSQHNINDTCTIQSINIAGTCQRLHDCPYTLQNLRRKLFPQICSYQHAGPLVCCPKRGYRSNLACLNYIQYSFNATTQSQMCYRATPLIYGGEATGRYEFPHMAAIGFNNPESNETLWNCGGSLISHDYVLTAGHCLSDHRFGHAVSVKLGVRELNDSHHKQEFGISEIVRYPQQSGHYNDIGLIKLNRSAELNPYVRPACLHLDREIKARKATATGWGTTMDGLQSFRLMKVALDLYNHSFCNQTYMNHINRHLKSGIEDEVHVCAGGDQMDSCSGDSGGPLQTYLDNNKTRCMYDIIGITSFGMAGCPSKAGVYTRVSNYIEWIENTVWPIV